MSSPLHVDFSARQSLTASLDRSGDELRHALAMSSDLARDHGFSGALSDWQQSADHLVQVLLALSSAVRTVGDALEQADSLVVRRFES